MSKCKKRQVQAIDNQFTNQEQKGLLIHVYKIKIRYFAFVFRYKKNIVFYNPLVFVYKTKHQLERERSLTLVPRPLTASGRVTVSVIFRARRKSRIHGIHESREYWRLP